MLAHQPTNAAAEREPRDSGRGDETTGGMQSVRRGRSIETAPDRATSRHSQSSSFVDAYRVQRAKIDHHTVVASPRACDVVGTAAYGKRQLVPPCKGDRRCDVGLIGCANDQRGKFVDRAVPD
jgi:hypothetical protein